MIRTWIGPKRFAFIPVWNNNVDNKPPDNWIEQIRARIFYDPSSTSGIDKSLQRYIQTISSGLASVVGEIFPVVEASNDDTVGAGLASLPTNHNFDYAVVILPHSAGPHRGGFAWIGGPETNGVSNFARVAMFSDQNMINPKTLGVWMMEILHIATGFGDLYYTVPMIDRFDVMACACGVHPTAHTKSHIGWLSPNAIKNQSLGQSRTHSLHAVSLPQPAPFWRSSAIKVQSRTSTGHFIIEARLKTDQYENSSEVSSGIPGEGVIVYEVHATTEIFLHTAVPLQVGEVFAIESEKLTVRIHATEPGGYSVGINTGKKSRCKELAGKIEVLELSLSVENDFIRRKQIISALQKARSEFRRLGCLLIHDPPQEVFTDKFFGSGPKSPISKDECNEKVIE